VVGGWGEYEGGDLSCIGKSIHQFSQRKYFSNKDIILEVTA
jgi:hypothetical protein